MELIMNTSIALNNSASVVASFGAMPPFEQAVLGFLARYSGATHREMQAA
jgi:hypothetical protein